MDVKLEDVWYTYDGVNYALSSVGMEFNGSGLYLVTGPNGSGKTTLLKVLALIHKPSKGRILINGVNPWSRGLTDSIRSSLAYVHDKPLIVKGDVDYNISLGLRLKNLEVAEGSIGYYIERYGLSEFRKRDARSLSAGNRRIVSILRALILKPKMLIIDEPFNHLDVKKVELLIEDLRELSRNTTIVMSTHYLYKEILECAKERYEIIAGRLRKL
ncbi:MAG: energy-coupling factor ABC transporter ATP-binding protein [Thermoprotei archaeon]|nr:energy-coupling factor ABC transporter ATP-binding protein [Thermoprotei archaeon]